MLKTNVKHKKQKDPQKMCQLIDFAGFSKCRFSIFLKDLFTQIIQSLVFLSRKIPLHIRIHRQLHAKLFSAYNTVCNAILSRYIKLRFINLEMCSCLQTVEHV